MKLARFTHSCLYIESPGRNALIDPGEFSKLNFETIERVDRLIITHNHPDHLDIKNINEVIRRFPELHIVSGPEVKNTLLELGVGDEVIHRPSTGCSLLFSAPHPRLPWAEKTAENFGVHFQSEVTHPGDSLEFTVSARILALPINAPWTSNKDAVEKVLTLDKRPEVVIPIHDWHLNPEARKDLYAKADKVLSREGIDFIPIEDGVLIDV